MTMTKATTKKSNSLIHSALRDMRGALGSAYCLIFPYICFFFFCPLAMNQDIGEQMAARGLRCSGQDSGLRVSILLHGPVLGVGSIWFLFHGFFFRLCFSLLFFCRPLAVSIHILRGRLPARIYTFLFGESRSALNC